MHYQISRNGQTYGPYTLDDLHRYVASGNVLLTDLAKSDDPDQTDWLPVSQVLNTQPQNSAPAQPFASPAAEPFQPVATPFAAPAAYSQPFQQPGFQPSPAVSASQYPDAPDLHWALYLLFAVITCTLFSKIMTVIQAAWLQRVQPNSKALLSYGVQYGILILSFIVRAITHTIVNVTMSTPGDPFAAYRHQNPIASLLGLLYFIMIFVSRFVMRAALEEHFNTAEPTGLRLNPVMTFFFGGVYFQYHLNRINALKQAARMGLPSLASRP